MPFTFQGIIITLIIIMRVAPGISSGHTSDTMVSAGTRQAARREVTFGLSAWGSTGGLTNVENDVAVKELMFNQIIPVFLL